MPIIFTVDHTRQEVRATAVGPITFEDVRAHLAQERQWEGLTYPELVDARPAAISLSPTEVREIVDLLRKLAITSHLGRTAVLVASDYQFGVARMLEALVEDVCEIKPFRDEGEAHLWLTGKSRVAT